MADVQGTLAVAPVGGTAAVAPVAAGSAPAPGAPQGASAGAAQAPAPQEDAAASPQAPLDVEKVRAAVKHANQSLEGINTQLVFVLEDQPPHFAVKLLDIETQKVLQQIPSQAMPATASALADSSSSGALVDASA